MYQGYDLLELLHRRFPDASEETIHSAAEYMLRQLIQWTKEDRIVISTFDKALLRRVQEGSLKPGDLDKLFDPRSDLLELAVAKVLTEREQNN